MEILLESAGWAGTVLIVTAYGLLSTGRLQARGRMYQWLNLAGALGVGVNVFHKQAWPALALQVIWAAIALVSLVAASRRSAR